MESLSHCPVCEHDKLSPFLSCIDHTVSRETFQIVQCNGCGFRFTNPRPAPAELGRYYQSEEYISHSGSKKGLINKLYHYVRGYTLLKKLQLVSALLSDKRQQNPALLDIGCGTGEFLGVCKKARWNVLGIEPSPAARDFGTKTYGIDVRPEDALKTLLNESYDIITMWHVLEHVPDLNGRIEELKRLIKPAGRIVIAVPNCSSADAKTYGAFWAAYDVPRHLYHFTPGDIRRVFSRHSMHVERILPMRFDSFYVSMLSDKYRSGKTRLLRSTWNGLISNLKAIRTGESYSSQIYIIRK
ncbi:MAG: class I SAM-dependent methyltransferase [Bacteroidota bacterium]